MGTISASLVTYASIQAFRPDLIINAGTAGGFKVCVCLGLQTIFRFHCYNLFSSSCIYCCLATLNFVFLNLDAKSKNRMQLVASFMDISISSFGFFIASPFAFLFPP